MRVFEAFLNKPQRGTIGQIQTVGNYETTGWSFFHKYSWVSQGWTEDKN